MIKEKDFNLRIFLYALIDLISKGEKISCLEVEKMLDDGIATKLCKEYTTEFLKNYFTDEYIQYVDEYFKEWKGCADNQEIRKYDCKEDEGFVLIIKLALNEIF